MKECNTNSDSNCSGKKAHHSESFKKNLVSRLNRIEGQIKGVTRMIENDIYCDDVLNQIQSVQGALSGARNMLLKAHISSCIKDAFKSGDDEIVDELMLTLKRMLK